jgi:hypothetical protein
MVHPDLKLYRTVLAALLTKYDDRYKSLFMLLLLIININFGFLINEWLNDLIIG